MAIVVTKFPPGQSLRTKGEHVKERKLRHLVTVGIITTAFAAALLPTTSASAAGACWSLYNSETTMRRLTNASRTSHGLSALPMDPDLAKVARRHSEEMATAGEPFHTGPDGYSRLLTGRWSAVHENVGAASAVSSDAGTDLRRLQREFMNSPAHRANILTRGADYVGIGVVRRNGRFYVTVLLVEGSNVGTSLRMPTC